MAEYYGWGETQFVFAPVCRPREKNSSSEIFSSDQSVLLVLVRKPPFAKLSSGEICNCLTASRQQYPGQPHQAHPRDDGLTAAKTYSRKDLITYNLTKELQPTATEIQ